MAALAGIMVMFCPPSTEDMSMEGNVFTIILLLAFIAFIGLPLLLFQFRNPNWGRDARMPGVDETKSVWKRAD